MDLVYITAILHPPDRTEVFMIFIQVFPLSTLVISSLTSPGSCDHDPTILVFLIHNFRKCGTGIFILVLGDYVIHGSGILDIDVHCEYGYRGIQINDFTLDCIISTTWNYNIVHLTKLVWWWDVDNIYRYAGPIDCTVNVNISDIWLRAISRVENVIYV